MDLRFYEADLPLDAEGAWTLTVDADGPNGAGPACAADGGQARTGSRPGLCPGGIRGANGAWGYGYGTAYVQDADGGSVRPKSVGLP